MDVVSVSPFRVGSVLWRSRPDRWTLTVICKGTYALAPGIASLSSEQEDVNDRDNFWDDDPHRSVYAPGDLAPFKPRADVMLVGHAFAPRSEMVRALTTRLIVGEMEKAVEVTSPRVWTREGELREGARWSKLPLRWECAAGGIETWNPVGVSAAAPPDPYGQRLLPNLQPPDLRVAQWADFFVPIGFGPIASTWRIRRDKLGARAAGWSDEAWPQIPLDDDFDGEFFQAAPLDQQIEALHDDATIVLEYLHPDHPRLTTKLPGVHPHAFVDVPGSAPHDLVMTADTLWIDTDRGLGTVTWRGQVAMEGPDQLGRVLLALEEPGERLTWPRVAALAGVPVTGRPPDSTTTPPHGRRPMPTLPFRLDPIELSPAAASVALTPPIELVEAERDVDQPPPTPRAGPRTRPMVTPADRLPATWLPQPGAEIAEPTPPSSAPRPAVHVPAPPVAIHALSLLWHAPALSGRLRRNSAWARILLPSNKSARSTMVSAALPDSAEAVEQALESDVTAILARGEPSAGDLEIALFEAVANGGALSPDLLLLAGDLELLFDEVRLIRALVLAATPLARGSAQLANVLEHAAAMAETPLQHAPEVAASLGASIREAWSQANHTLPEEHLESLTGRLLLATRAFQRRDLFGETWVRALFTPSGAGATVPAYLPESAARRLPLFTRLSVRMLAEVVPQQDQTEESAVALRVAALGRMVSRSRRAEG